MRISSSFLFTVGILVGIGFDAWFAQILDITSILITKIGPELYQWVPSHQWFPPMAMQILAWWTVGLIIIVGTVTTARRLRGSTEEV